jgi:hypothetical protein
MGPKLVQEGEGDLAVMGELLERLRRPYWRRCVFHSRESDGPGFQLVVTTLPVSPALLRSGPVQPGAEGVGPGEPLHQPVPLQTRPETRFAARSAT